MALPIVAGSEVSTPAGGTKIDPNAFREAALARGQVLGTAGQDVASLFTDLQTKMQDARNAKNVFDAD